MHVNLHLYRNIQAEPTCRKRFRVHAQLKFSYWSKMSLTALWVPDRAAVNRLSSVFFVAKLAPVSLEGCVQLLPRWVHWEACKPGSVSSSLKCNISLLLLVKEDSSQPNGPLAELEPAAFSGYSSNKLQVTSTDGQFFVKATAAIFSAVHTVGSSCFNNTPNASAADCTTSAFSFSDATTARLLPTSHWTTRTSLKSVAVTMTSWSWL